MLKTNSKVVREKIRAYILVNALDENYESFDKLEDACIYIVNDVKRVCGAYSWNRKYNFDGWSQRDFADWCRGLPGVFDCEFIYRVSAVDFLDFTIFNSFFILLEVLYYIFILLLVNCSY